MQRTLSDWKASMISWSPCSPLLSQSVHVASCSSYLSLLDGRKEGKMKEATRTAKAIWFTRRSRHREGKMGMVRQKGRRKVGRRE